ncbi:hypothetical protein C5615_38565 [Burkholderia cepacia]|uniref:Uncharacterized protein n=1 Tax=Burkholderia cepacia TaxID=292 RepID=A0A2S8HUS5_BURCE|nr:hypothetical protein [Burkholderia cepacia]PQP06145.1 hypothetical protein C5615_38565 [Burkholderia cepacia]
MRYVDVERQRLYVVELEQRAIGGPRQIVVHHRAEIGFFPLTAIDTPQQRLAGQHDLSLAIRARLLDLLALRLGCRLAGRFQLLQLIVCRIETTFQHVHSGVLFEEAACSGTRRTGVRRIVTFAPYCRAQARTAASTSTVGGMFANISIVQPPSRFGAIYAGRQLPSARISITNSDVSTLSRQVSTTAWGKGSLGWGIVFYRNRNKGFQARTAENFVTPIRALQ